MERTRIVKVLNSLITNRLLQHLIFWGVAYAILLNVFRINDDLGLVDYIYTAIFLITLIIAVYINLLLIIPYLLVRRNYLYFFLSIVALLFTGSLFNEFVFNNLVDLIFPGFYFISYYSLLDLGKFFVIFIGLSSLLKLSKGWFQLIDSKQKLSEVEKQKADIELKALRAQVNPHFLFNSLNVLYSLALKESKESPDAIISLSDILRYVIYESNKEYVKISSEIKLISDYLALQRYRIDDSSDISFNSHSDVDNDIAPMLLLPLVENSFKHGIKGDLKGTYVRIGLSSDSKGIRFEIENNRGELIENIESERKGVGLKNIKHRLNLIYPDNHIFDIISTDETFRVLLILQNED